MGGGAWPFLVGGVIRLLNCDNERDLNLLTSHANGRCVKCETTVEHGSWHDSWPTS